MSSIELNETLLARIAGWEAIKEARSLVAADRVLSSDWAPPVLKGVVQQGSASYRAGLVIKDAINVENLCTCRASRSWGTICAHSVAVGLHFLQPVKQVIPKQPDGKPAGSASPGDPPGPAGSRSPTSTGNDRSGGARTSSVRRAAPGEAGLAARLTVILPPKLAVGGRGPVMVCLEARWEGGGAPLNALPADQSFQFDAQDGALLDLMEEFSAGSIPGAVQIDAGEFTRVLERLVGHPRVSLGRKEVVEVSLEPWRLPLSAELRAAGDLQLSCGALTTQCRLFVGSSTWALRGNRFQPVGLPSALANLGEGPLRIDRSQVPQFLQQDWPGLALDCELSANFRLEDFTIETSNPLIELALDGGLAQLSAKLTFRYGDQAMNPAAAVDPSSLWITVPQQPRTYRLRHVEAEQAAVSVLVRAGFVGPDRDGQWQMRGQDNVVSFFARVYPRLQREWSVTLQERLQRSCDRHFERIEPQVQVSPHGMRWFDVSVEFASRAGDRFGAADIQRLLLSGQSHLKLRDGRFALVDTGAVEEFQEVLRDCEPEQGGGGYRLASEHAGFVRATLQEQGWGGARPGDWSAQVGQPAGSAKPKCPPLGALENVLRPYQKEGVAWMLFLRRLGFGGVLADEMGLGKTLQALAYMWAVRHSAAPGAGEKPGRDATTPPGPVLVVCPTSLVFNWAEEAARFAPDLRVLSISGPDRQTQFASIPRSDLVITSFALMRRDLERYREFEFDTVMLDEAQHIKNRRTQNAQAVKAIRGRHRFVLTGTPLENSVLDAWSIFDFLMPGYLGSAHDFQERYEVPLARGRNETVQSRLSRRLRPFLLRRTKREVAPELPERIEKVVFCELNDEQQSLYRQLLDAGRREVLEAGLDKNEGRARMVAFTALLRLRQICCDARLLKLKRAPSTGTGSADGSEEPGDESESGKLASFAELLNEVVDGGHRVLVFSQFVEMLKLLRERLQQEGIGFCYLDGSTVNRQEVVGRFQSDGRIPAFLISLKAGGVGLNLTGADTVIHFDPWWNPAVERQASDRAHRIGQTRAVTVYRLIARGTVEEKMLQLQARKQELLAGVLGDEALLATALSWDEIRDLFD